MEFETVRKAKIMDSIQLFNFNGNQVRTVLVNDEPYFVGKDVADILGYQDLNRAISQHVDREDRKSLSRKDKGDSYPSLWNNDNDYKHKVVINESGVYSLVFSSELPTAKEFKHWVTSEVLPSIRKHGAYMTDEKAEQVTNGTGLADLLIQAGEQLKKKNKQIAEMKPKALFADSVSTSKTTVLVGELAKILKGNGIDIGANRLFIWLRENGYLIIRKGTDWNMPTQKAMNLGLFKIKETAINHSNGTTTVSKTPKVTGKGQQYFINKLLIEQDNLR